MIQVRRAPASKTQVQPTSTDNNKFMKDSKSEGDNKEINQIEDQFGASSNMYCQNFLQPW